MKELRLSHRNRGFALVELVCALAVGLGVIAGGLVFYGEMQENSTSNHIMRSMTFVQSTVSSRLPDIERQSTVKVSSTIGIDALPGFTDTGDGALRHDWAKGGVTFDRLGKGVVRFSLDGVTSRRCRKLASRLASADVTPGFQSHLVIGNTVFDGYMSGSVDRIVAACDSEANSVGLIMASSTPTLRIVSADQGLVLASMEGGGASPTAPAFLPGLPGQTPGGGSPSITMLAGDLDGGAGGTPTGVASSGVAGTETSGGTGAGTPTDVASSGVAGTETSGGTGAGTGALTDTAIAGVAGTETAATEAGTTGSDSGVTVPDYQMSGIKFPNGNGLSEKTVTSSNVTEIADGVDVSGQTIKIWGDGDPTIRLADGERSTEGLVGDSGTNIKMDMPECGGSYTIYIETEDGEIGAYTLDNINTKKGGGVSC
ncbi:hypothetical protein [Defluviimonas salinarum]|uniref:Prepilin-type N-terminal cleavage/methylation domain-containing protein n=1 Tax=Defluviimonas salinarum TaxID=2992147 RepID=A0ABT3J9D0_9RHOB|nr:hypothetical protein [Defluviimonas salinarum]MCW3784298.1 hypothetical protein [Defluviimonas salinarum]